MSFDDEHAAEDLASLVREQRLAKGCFPGPCAVLQRGGGSGLGGAIVAESDVEGAKAAGADGVVIQAAAAREVRPPRVTQIIWRGAFGDWWLDRSADGIMCTSLTTNVRAWCGRSLQFWCARHVRLDSRLSSRLRPTPCTAGRVHQPRVIEKLTLGRAGERVG